MKFFGKNPGSPLSAIPGLNQNQQKQINSLVNQPNFISADTSDLIVPSDSIKTSSVKLINCVEPFTIRDTKYTLFYTEFDTKLKVGERVFIVSGNYDSNFLIQTTDYSQFTDGYKVLYADKTKVVLDIKYDGRLPFQVDEIDNFIKVYVASSQDDFDYFIQTTSTRDFPYLVNRFSNIGTFSTNNLLYINGTFSVSGNEWGILGFTSSGVSSLTYSNSFLILAGTTSGYLQDISPNINTGIFSKYLSATLECNRNMKIMNDSFRTTSGKLFQNGYIYRWCKSCGEWQVNISFKPAFITKLNFRNGFFSQGFFNQGLMGTHVERIVHNSNSSIVFNLGTILNTDFNGGQIQNGNILPNEGPQIDSYSTNFESGIPSIIRLKPNNSGWGYNFFYDSTFYDVLISKANIYDSILGSSSNTVVYEYLTGVTSSFEVSILEKAQIFNSIAYKSSLLHSDIYSSRVVNSYVNKSKSINSEFEKTVFYNSNFVSDKIIKLDNFDERTVTWWSDNTETQFKLYKFYISLDKFQRLVESQSFYFDGLQINKPNTEVLNFFDDKFTIDAYGASYDGITGKQLKKVIVQLSTPAENLRIVDGSDIDFKNLLLDNKKNGLPSIDILISEGEDFNSTVDLIGDDIFTYDFSDFENSVYWGGPTFGYVNVQVDESIFTFTSSLTYSSIYDGLVSLGTGSWTYSNTTFTVQSEYTFGVITLEDEGLDKFSAIPTQKITEVILQNNDVLNINKSYILDSDFKSGLFLNSIWSSGNYINYNQDHTLPVLNNSDTYSGINIDNSTGYMTLNLLSSNRRRISNINDVVFFNRLEFDSQLIGYQNLVRLPDTYKIEFLNESNNSYLLEDFLNSTQSVFFTLTQSISSESVLTTKLAENSYNYLHPVKFKDSTIRSGIFRRAYFEGTTFDNDEFDLSQRDPLQLTGGVIDYTNWRRLLVSDTIFSDNSNNFKSGLLLFSHWVSGSDNWENGIVQNSIWNNANYSWSLGLTSSVLVTSFANKFKNGIFRQSRWINGNFENGIFYKNNSNLVYTTSVFSDETDAYYRFKNSSGEGKTRWSFLNGVFEDGVFEMSHFEMGLFENGQFFKSTFLDGVATGGLFGRKNIPYSLTRVGAGTFSGLNVINANFVAENPTGQLDSYHNIQWLEGVFNNGVFGVRVESASYSTEKLNYRFQSNWYDGTFNNGTFQDTAVWHFGEFNNGKFVSYYGYPFIITASYSTSASQSFAWRGGYFNGGIFGNANLGTNSTWFNGEFNGGIFNGRYWQNGVFTRGYFIGSGTNSTALAYVPNFVSDYSESYYGLWNSGYVSELPDKLFSDKEIYSSPIRTIDRKKKDLTANLKNMLWRGGTFSHGDGQINNSVWLGGVFERGNFVNSSFNPYTNYLVNGEFKLSQDLSIGDPSLDFWTSLYSDYTIETVNNDTQINLLNGNFDSEGDGIFSKKLIFSGTSSQGKIYQTAGLIIGETYKLRLKLKYNENCLIKYGSYTDILRNRNFTEGYSFWTIALTASNTSNNAPSLTVATGSIGHINFTNNSTGDGRAYLIYQDVLVEGLEVNLRLYHYNRQTPGTGISFTIGSCDTSQVEIDSEILVTNFTETISASFSGGGGANITNVYSDSFVPVFKDLLIVIDSTNANESIDITGITLTNNRTLYSSNLTQSSIIEASFVADGGDFALDFVPSAILNSASDPIYLTASVEVNFVEIIKGDSGFNTSEDCVWKGGKLINSEFYYSVWENGFWENGLAMGMIWKNGISKYMNAYNVYWQGGLWRNGNWNGSPWSLENITEDGCIYSYQSSGLPVVFVNKQFNWGFSGNRVGPVNTSGLTFSVYAGGGSPNPEDSDLDSDNITSDVYNNGYFYASTNVAVSTPGKRYKVTINIDKLSISDQQYKDRAAIYFSLGQINVPYGNYGNANTMLYPSTAEEATGLSNLSLRYQITNLSGHVGQVISDLYNVGTDGYQSTNPGTITEIIDSTDDGKLYIHADLFGVFELNIDSVTIEEEICTKTGVVNTGFARDLMAHISDYRQSISDPEYKTIHMNDVFVEDIDNTWPSFPGQISQLRFTFSSISAQWSYQPSFIVYNGSTVNCTNLGPSIPNSSNIVYNTPSYQSTFGSTVNLYAMSNNNPNIFTQSGDYQITMKYICDYESTNPVTNAEVKFYINVGYSANVIGNGGYRQTAIEPIRIRPVIRSSSNSSSTSGPVASGCNPIGKYYGRTQERTLQFTFTPLGFADYSNDTKDSFRFSIRKFSSTFGSRLIITYLKIELKNTQYSSEYNNKLYNIFDTSPQIGDILALPATQSVNGVTSSIVYSGGASNGLPISIRFGNGIFTSGTASAFSSIWEYGVWNEGWRYDKNVIYFTNFMSFNGTQKPLVYAGTLETKKVKSGEIANQFDQNFTQLKPSLRIFTLALYRTIGILNFDDDLVINQQPTPEERSDGTYTLRSQLKVGDRVSVGNIVAVDVNGERRLITDTFKVVDVISPENSSEGNLDILYLQVTLNFDAKTIKRDSEDHLINVTKNAWLNGAFLNGYFRGVWTNGLFKGRPYITKMKDSQWISGIFDGGHFQAKSISYPIGSDEDLATFSAPSGVIQNFIFKDNDQKLTPYQHSYNSWIDVNYYTSSVVTVGEEQSSNIDPENDGKLLLNVFFGLPLILGENTPTNFLGYPTNDVLRSESYLRNNTNSNFSTYKLGSKYKESTNYLEVDGGQVVNSPLREALNIPPFDNDINIGLFNRYYNTVGTASLRDRLGVGLKNFITDGFTYGTLEAYKFSDPPTTFEAPGYISNNTTGNLGVLEIKPNPKNRPIVPGGGGVIHSDVLDNTYVTNNFKSNRYNYITFDYITTGSASLFFSVYPPLGEIKSSTAIVPKTQLDLRKRGVTKIKDYFYNKRGLKLNYVNFIEGSGVFDALGFGTYSTTKIDNLKFVETDMIPFFLLGTESRINQKVAIPLGAVSPFIDFRDYETSFLDLLVISETIFTPLQNPSVVVTPGAGSSGGGKLDTLLDEEYVASVAPGNITGGGLAVTGGIINSSSTPGKLTDFSSSSQTSPSQISQENRSN